MHRGEEDCQRKLWTSPTESVKENSLDVPSVPHKTQKEEQKLRVTLLRLPAEGEPCECECECEQEAAAIVGMAGGTSGMPELPM